MKGKIIGVAIVLAGVLAVAAVPTATSNAQCGVPVRTVHGTHVVHRPFTPSVVVKEVVHDHVVKEIVTPIAVPILVPAFQFQYTPPCQTCAPVVSNPIGTPGYVPGAAAPGYGHGQAPAPGYGPPAAPAPVGGPPAVGAPPAPAPAPAGNQDKIRELARALLEEMQRQQQQGDPNDSGPPVVVDPNAPAAPPAPVGGPPAAPAPVGGPPVGQQPAVDKAALAQFSVAALQRNCAACHTGLGSKGDTVIFSQPGVLNAQAPWKTIAKEIQSGRMPPRSSQYKLTPQEATATLQWLASL